MSSVLSPENSQALRLIDAHRTEFINTIQRVYGTNFKAKNYAEDYLHEVYLKLSRYDNLHEKVIKPDGSVSKGYVFFAIRSVVLNDIKKKKAAVGRLSDACDGAGVRGELLIDEGRDATDIKRDEIEEEMYRVAEENLHWFDFQLFKTYLSEGKSFRLLAAETGLGIQTIYLSIKKTKMLIAEKLFEQYSNLKKEVC